MLKKLMKTAVAAASILAGASAAQAAVNVTIEQNGFGSGPIEVISENGTSWTKVKSGDITLPVKLYMGITSGKLGSYGIKQNGTWINHSGEWIDGPNPYQTTKTVTGSTDNFVFEKLTILNMCNEKLNVGEGIHQTHTTWFFVPLTLVANFNMTNDQSYPPYEGYGHVPVPVHCKPVMKKGPGGIANNPGDQLIKEAKLFLTTISTGQNTGHTLGGCKTLKTTVRFETNQLGPVSFELHRFPGGMTNHTVDAEFEADTGKYYARYHKYETFQTTTSVQYMAKSTSPSAGNTGWKSITIHCGGGLATAPNPVNPDDIPQAKNVEGDFAFIDHGSPKCTRTGKALITLRSPKPDNIHWSLDCKDKNHSGVAPTVPHPDGDYAAAALVSFDVEKTYTEACTLRTVAPYGPEDHVNKTHLYQCVTPSGHSASNDVQVPSNPPSGKPDIPATLVPTAPHKVIVGSGSSSYPVPLWKCVGGSFKNNECVCRTGWKPVPWTVKEHGILRYGEKCVPAGPGNKTTVPNDRSLKGLVIVKPDAEKHRLKAVKDAAEAKRKRDAAIAKRKRDAAIARQLEARKKAAAAAALRAKVLKAQQDAARKAATAALVRRNAAAALARRNAAVKRRAAPSSIGTATQMRVIRRR